MSKKIGLENNLMELKKHSAQRDALEKLIKLQGAGFREKPIGINHLRVLDEIAICGECTKQYLQVRLGIDENTIKGQLQRLSTKGAQGRRGLGLIKVRVDRSSYTTNYYSLTVKGKRIHQALFSVS